MTSRVETLVLMWLVELIETTSHRLYSDPPGVLSWPFELLVSLLVGSGNQHAQRKCGASVLALGQGHFVEVWSFSGPRRCPFCGHVPSGMFGQVVAAHEASITHIANKLLLTSVRSAVAGKLIGARKLFVAALPVTTERLFTCRKKGLLSTKC